MMTALAYFEGTEPAGIRRLLRTWLACYERSGTAFRPCLLLDRDTPVPDFWQYATVRLREPEPPFREHVLQKADWMKVQAFDVLGKCLVLDLDAIVVKPLDALAALETEIALAPDPGRRTYAEWPEVGEELNIGVMLLNSPRIFPHFRERFGGRREFARLPWFGQLILSEFCRDSGTLLEERLNWSHWHGNLPDDVSVLHFHGNGKERLEAFARDWLARPSSKASSDAAVVRRASTIDIRYRGRLDDGTVFDEVTEPVTVTIGQRELPERLEEALLGAVTGECRTVPLGANDAFGPRRVDLAVEVERRVLAPHFRIEIGETVEVPCDDSEPFVGSITAVADDTVTVDANHPLAGRDIVYELDVVAVRQPIS